MFGLPVALTLESASSCNLHCPDCPRGANSLTRSKGLMSMALFERLVDDLWAYTLHAQLFFQGEPTLNANLVSMVEVLSAKRIFSVISTNGQLVTADIAQGLVRAQLGKIIVSVDGTTQEVYSRYRVGGALDRALDAIQLVARAKKQQNASYPIIEMQMLVFSYNLHQIPDAKQLAKQYGANVVTFKTAQFTYPNQEKALIPLDTKYSRYYVSPHGDVLLKGNPSVSCSKPWFSSVIAYNGTVAPCCWDKDASVSLGGADAESFRSIWFGEEYNRFRLRLLSNKQQIPICADCPNGRTRFGFH